MGADLYLMSQFEPAHEKWRARFDAAAAERDRQEQGTREYQRAQRLVERCYARMYATGYFRDPYNDWDMLWKFGLSWWGDVIPMLDPDGCLPVAGIERLLQMLADREDTFQKNLAGLPARDARYFRRQARELAALLTTAKERGEPIRCSL